MSRGRQSNRLYLAAERSTTSAPSTRPRRPPTDRSVERLARRLRVEQRAGARHRLRSRRSRPVGASAEALERAAARAARLESRSLGWLPGRRRELEAAREREVAARRERLEAAARRPAVRRRAEFAATASTALHARHAERATERALRRDEGSVESCERAADSDADWSRTLCGSIPTTSTRSPCASPRCCSEPAAPRCRSGWSTRRRWRRSSASSATGSTRTRDELHAVRLGGERGRLRFDLARVFRSLERGRTDATADRQLVAAATTLMQLGGELLPIDP